VPEPAVNQKRQEIVDLLQKWGKPMSPQEIAAALGRDVVNVKMLLFKLVKTGEVLKCDYGKYSVSGGEMVGMPITSITPITLASTDEPVDPTAARSTLITTNVLGSPNKKKYIYILMY